MNGIMFITIALITMIGSFTTEIYLPSLGDIASITHESMASVNLIITIFFISYGLAQLFLGVLMDRYGRKPILLIGIFIYTLGSLISYIFSIFGLLLFARVLQGIGVASVAIAGISMIQDMTNGRNSTSKQALLNSIKGFAPAIAPMIGTIIETYSGWKGVSLFTLCLSIVMLTGSCMFIKESAHKKVKISHDQLKISFNQLLNSKSFVKNLIIYTAAFSMFLITVSNSEYLYINEDHISMSLFGIFLTISALSIPVSSFITSRLSKKISASYIIKIGITLACIGVLIFSLNYWLNWISLLLGSICILSGVHFIMPCALTKGLSSHKRITATAASIMGSSRNLGAGLATIISTFCMAYHFLFIVYLMLFILLMICLTSSTVSFLFILKDSTKRQINLSVMSPIL